MTGFGSAEGDVGGGRVAVEIRSVNHRFFTPSIKLPSTLSKFEGDARELLRRRVSRGHVTLSARFVSQHTGEARIDQERFAAYLEQLRGLAARHDIAVPVDVASVLRLPDVIISADTPSTIDDGGPFLKVVEEAAQQHDAMRAAEGARLVAYLDERLASIETSMAAIATRAPDRVVLQRDRLRAAVKELLDGALPDEQRLAQEIAILADRLDVGEEVQRFESHIQAFREALRKPPADGVGKRLGFLLQELLREANTTGSKANDAEITRNVLTIKEELERLREQVENLE